MKNLFRKTSMVTLLLSVIAFFGCGSDDDTTAVQSIQLSETEITLNIDQSALVNAIVSPSDASDKTIKWSSENDKIATVNNGTILAVASGETNIIAASASNPNVTAKVKVIVREDLTAGIAGTYTGSGIVSLGGNELPGLPADIELKAKNTTTLSWSMSLDLTPLNAIGIFGAFELKDVDVAVEKGEGGILKLSGNGTAEDNKLAFGGPDQLMTPTFTFEGQIDSKGAISLTIIVDGAPLEVAYTGTKKN
jgi:hypothetical protein